MANEKTLKIAYKEASKALKAVMDCLRKGIETKKIDITNPKHLEALKTIVHNL